MLRIAPPYDSLAILALACTPNILSVVSLAYARQLPRLAGQHLQKKHRLSLAKTFPLALFSHLFSLKSFLPPGLLSTKISITKQFEKKQRLHLYIRENINCLTTFLQMESY